MGSWANRHDRCETFYLIEEGDMKTQCRFLAFVIFLAFFLSVIATGTSFAKNNSQSPKKSTQKITSSGTVLEIIHKDPEFDFLRIQTGTSDQWVAAPKKSFKKGDVVTCEEGFVLENYNIKGLKRTFEQIVFTECSKN